MDTSKGNQTKKRKRQIPLVIPENRRSYLIQRYQPHNRRVVYDSSSDEDNNSTKIVNETGSNKQVVVPVSIATENPVSSDSVKQSENSIEDTTAVTVKKKLRSKLNL